MREARIILPRNGNNGESLNHVHAGLRRALCEAFGGCTAILVKGAWLDDSGKLYDEEGIAYDIACVVSPETSSKLRTIAEHVAREASQICVYLRHSGGDVEFVKPETVPA
jgi:hypothetical protein